MVQLRELIQNLRIPIALHQGLIYTSQNVQDMEQVGVIWIDDDTFLINVHIFGRFINKKEDTIKHNLKNHGFFTVPMTMNEKNRKFEMLNVNTHLLKSWVAIKHPYYCKNSDEMAVNSIRFIR